MALSIEHWAGGMDGMRRRECCKPAPPRGRRGCGAASQHSLAGAEDAVLQAGTSSGAPPAKCCKLALENGVSPTKCWMAALPKGRPRRSARWQHALRCVPDEVLDCSTPSGASPTKCWIAALPKGRPRRSAGLQHYCSSSATTRLRLDSGWDRRFGERALARDWKPTSQMWYFQRVTSHATKEAPTDGSISAHHFIAPRPGFVVVALVCFVCAARLWPSGAPLGAGDRDG